MASIKGAVGLLRDVVETFHRDIVEEDVQPIVDAVAKDGTIDALEAKEIRTLVAPYEQFMDVKSQAAIMNLFQLRGPTRARMAPFETKPSVDNNFRSASYQAGPKANIVAGQLDEQGNRQGLWATTQMNGVAYKYYEDGKALDVKVQEADVSGVSVRIVTRMVDMSQADKPVLRPQIWKIICADGEGFFPAGWPFAEAARTTLLADASLNKLVPVRGEVKALDIAFNNEIKTWVVRWTDDKGEHEVFKTQNDILKVATLSRMCARVVDLND